MDENAVDHEQEIEALRQVVDALAPFDHETRMRMGRYLWDRLNEGAWERPLRGPSGGRP
jgi:hypothetical protein